MKKIADYIHFFTEASQRLGATYTEGQGTHIRLWAPYAETLDISWQNQEAIPLKKSDDYFTGFFPEAIPGDCYSFHLNDKKIADPASRFQPQGPFGPSQIVTMDYAWTDRTWAGIPFSEWVIYEVHPGTYSEQHGFDGIIADLTRLKDLGITTIELMPVAQFSNERNWGYDGAFPHAVQNSYGGPEKLKALVDACHAHGLAIILDVVFNHIGPEGNVLFDCGPYTTDSYQTPWGKALNFDGPHNHQVRRYFLQAAWQWLTEYHFDGLRLDAVHMILDHAPMSFLQELSLLKTEAEKQRGHDLILIGEIDTNDARVLMPLDQNGFALNAHWADDLHHALHAVLTGEQDGYYADYGDLAQLAKIYRRGVAFEDEYSPFRQRYHGRSYDGIDKKSLIVETQNHDQIGNRLKGERFISLVGFEKAKLAAAAILLSPFTPHLFMGEEFASMQPFLYFIHQHDEELNKKCRESRAEEWKSFGWDEEAPDPSAEETFLRCVLLDKNPSDHQSVNMVAYYKELIALSKEIRACDNADVAYDAQKKHITLTYKNGKSEIAVLLAFDDQETKSAKPSHPVLQSSWYPINGEMNPNSSNIAIIPAWSASVWKKQ